MKSQSWSPYQTQMLWVRMLCWQSKHPPVIVVVLWLSGWRRQSWDNTGICRPVTTETLFLIACVTEEADDSCVARNGDVGRRGGTAEPTCTWKKKHCTVKYQHQQHDHSSAWTLRIWGVIIITNLMFPCFLHWWRPRSHYRFPEGS